MIRPYGILPTGDQAEDTESDTPDIEFGTVVGPTAWGVLEGVDEFGRVEGGGSAACC